MKKFWVTLFLTGMMGGLVIAREPVKLKTSDGKEIEGILYSNGKEKIGLVLCHGRGYKNGAASFAKEGSFFEKNGIMCLALSFRGYPAEKVPPFQKNRYLDIVAAMDFLKGRGAQKTYVLGSSMGGFTALSALKLLSSKDGFAGIIVMSAYNGKTKTVKDSDARKLFITAKDDRAYYSNVKATYEIAKDPKELIEYDTGGHGQSLFNTHGEKLLKKIVDFIRGAAGPAEPK